MSLAYKLWTSEEMAMNDSERNRSHLFTVRLWQEQMDNQQMEVRGKVRHVLSGETRYFRHMTGLTEWLAAYFNSVEGRDGME